jgi:cobalt-zinc-cadmium efflux system outer membrane protein
MRAVYLKMLPVFCIAALIVSPHVILAQESQHGTDQNTTSEQGPPQAKLTLEDLEQLALKHNPTLAQVADAIQAAKGRKLQAGLYPNPVVGYDGDEIRPGPITRGGEHGFFIQQDIVTGGKLRLNRKAAGEEQAQEEARAEAQRDRVLTSVRILYYETLGAQQLLELRQHLAEVAGQAVTTSKQLYNVGQADEPDVLEAEAEAGVTQLAVFDAQNNRQRLWQQLAATVGVPDLPLTSLAGNLEHPLPSLSRDQTLATILAASPEMKAAEAGLRRAEWALQRSRVAPIPDIQFRGGMRHNRELLESPLGRPFGLEGFAEVGVQIPIFNRNQGNVQSAQAELASARQEVERVRLSLEQRFALAFQDYSNSLEAAGRYQNDILPKAQRAYELYLNKYHEMAAAFPQVLIAQRTWFQLQEDYIGSLVRLWSAVSEIRGMLLTGALETFGST